MPVVVRDDGHGQQGNGGKEQDGSSTIHDMTSIKLIPRASRVDGCIGTARHSQLQKRTCVSGSSSDRLVRHEIVTGSP
jgi:hypothetical protein